MTIHSESAIHNYQDALNNLHSSRYQEYPRVISMETLTLCNARCTFCPYKDLKRKGLKMPDYLVDKIISEIGDLPHDLPLVVNLSRVNEALLDPRFFDIAKKIKKAAPQTLFALFSNGSTLNDSNVSRLLELQDILSLNISLNFLNKQDYENNMKLRYDVILQNINSLHNLKEEGKLYFKITISRVGDNSKEDAEFEKWVKSAWPLFTVNILPRSGWMGKLPPSSDIVPDAACTQWFKVHILSDGKEAFCCIDSEGAYGSGTIYDQHLLEIYNHQYKKMLRTSLISRNKVSQCKNCPLLS